eukprot:g45374.t1
MLGTAMDEIRVQRACTFLDSQKNMLAAAIDQAREEGASGQLCALVTPRAHLHQHQQATMDSHSSTCKRPSPTAAESAKWQGCPPLPLSWPESELGEDGLNGEEGWDSECAKELLQDISMLPEEVEGLRAAMRELEDGRHKADQDRRWWRRASLSNLAMQRPANAKQQPEQPAALSKLALPDADTEQLDKGQLPPSSWGWRLARSPRYAGSESSQNAPLPAAIPNEQPQSTLRQPPSRRATVLPRAPKRNKPPVLPPRPVLSSAAEPALPPRPSARSLAEAREQTSTPPGHEPAAQQGGTDTEDDSARSTDNSDGNERSREGYLGTPSLGASTKTPSAVSLDLSASPVSKSSSAMSSIHRAKRLDFAGAGQSSLPVQAAPSMEPGLSLPQLPTPKTSTSSSLPVPLPVPTKKHPSGKPRPSTPSAASKSPSVQLPAPVASEADACEERRPSLSEETGSRVSVDKQTGKPAASNQVPRPPPAKPRPSSAVSKPLPSQPVSKSSPFKALPLAAVASKRAPPSKPLPSIALLRPPPLRAASAQPMMGRAAPANPGEVMPTSTQALPDTDKLQAPQPRALGQTSPSKTSTANTQALPFLKSPPLAKVSVNPPAHDVAGKALVKLAVRSPPPKPASQLAGASQAGSATSAAITSARLQQDFLRSPPSKPTSGQALHISLVSPAAHASMLGAASSLSEILPAPAEKPAETLSQILPAAPVDRPSSAALRSPMSKVLPVDGDKIHAPQPPLGQTANTQAQPAATAATNTENSSPAKRMADTSRAIFSPQAAGEKKMAVPHAAAESSADTPSQQVISKSLPPIHSSAFPRPQSLKSPPARKVSIDLPAQNVSAKALIKPAIRSPPPKPAAQLSGATQTATALVSPAIKSAPVKETLAQILPGAPADGPAALVSTRRTDNEMKIKDSTLEATAAEQPLYRRESVAHAGSLHLSSQAKKDKLEQLLARKLSKPQFFSPPHPAARTNEPAQGSTKRSFSFLPQKLATSPSFTQQQPKSPPQSLSSPSSPTPKHKTKKLNDLYFSSKRQNQEKYIQETQALLEQIATLRNEADKAKASCRLVETNEARMSARLQEALAKQSELQAELAQAHSNEEQAGKTAASLQAHNDEMVEQLAKLRRQLELEKENAQDLMQQLQTERKERTELDVRLHQERRQFEAELAKRDAKLEVAARSFAPDKEFMEKQLHQQAERLKLLERKLEADPRRFKKTNKVLPKPSGRADPLFEQALYATSDELSPTSGSSALPSTPRLVRQRLVHFQTGMSHDNKENSSPQTNAAGASSPKTAAESPASLVGRFTSPGAFSSLLLASSSQATKTLSRLRRVSPLAESSTRASLSPRSFEQNLPKMAVLAESGEDDDCIQPRTLIHFSSPQAGPRTSSRTAAAEEGLSSPR